MINRNNSYNCNAYPFLISIMILLLLLHDLLRTECTHVVLDIGTENSIYAQHMIFNRRFKAEFSTSLSKRLELTVYNNNEVSNSLMTFPDY
ncbi:hypothetical protein T4B_14524 [Trichinella pseudospiralis]|uniref:Uncharacterized protein n=1 Tax=Trichinella pseudospiralis TaxID=6337 RepID=A0A0V1JC45_TRIPS|nr:hypothetical protein T4B_14524 [Trichinella pseudospiralis]